MGSIYQPAGREQLYLRYKDPTSGQWKSKATPFTPDQRDQAERLLAKLEPGSAPAPLSVDAWSRDWLFGREKAGIADAANDEARLRLHVLPVIGKKPLREVTPKDLLVVVERLKADGAAPRTVRNVYSVCRSLFRDAAVEGHITSTPCILAARQLGKMRDADLGWRAQAVFGRNELLALIGDLRVPFDRRVLYGLLGVGMMRTGEACGLRWRHIQKAEPLDRIVVGHSYDKDTTKTETERWMPVHSTLAVLLDGWRAFGWPASMGRKPTEDDLVVPCPRPTNKGRQHRWGSMRDKQMVMERFKVDLAALGLRHRRVHDLRRTGISLAIEDGADENILRRGTHAPPTHVMALYTSVAWAALCREVVKLRVGVEREPSALTTVPRVKRRRAPGR